MHTTIPEQLTATLARCALVAVALAVSPASAQDATALAKAAQNPIADMISLPFQSNSNFKVGPLEDTQEILNIQPVYPVSLNAEWNFITRTILPVTSQPAFTSTRDRESGIGDARFSAFPSPKQVAGGWVYGALANHVWSVEEDDGRRSVNQMLVQRFINYIFPDAPGRYLAFSPIMTADWKADSDQRWVVPLGLGIGQIPRFGKQPVNLQASACCNVERPDTAAQWQLPFTDAVPVSKVKI